MYKVLSLITSVLGSVLAGMLFKRVWKLAAGEDRAPDAEDLSRGWIEVLAAAAVHGAITGMVKGATKRASAKSMRRAAERRREPAEVGP
ncbi:MULTISPECIES: DUF4235 domain-containing protein [Thermomonospora]|uniref:Integral membrane protein n=1 Tax=Thermomonospora curvata (strain ATCC 19995 / DSM 43183 / JCM 3096 / KCTC 9072 / NBRC 15933 / NCIMB 10081 / Henssen B9) TaxID=471852 RepID=D1A9B3_THECD|nr:MULTISPECIES: DUF4235 domain-containing protein [Thermomonospora]ACY96809.1 hypothetical protein Tcur_1226 [Thermomonospora curvata DSM 43183]PKK15105.1 MAG: DUF4235 domain-containing protein [Thermomonospora sp. CIF 1]